MIPGNLGSILAARRKYVDEVSSVHESVGMELRTSTNESQFGAGFFAEKTLPGYTGLINQGATCYLNSLVQALYMIPEFRAAVFSTDTLSPTSVISTLQYLFGDLSHSSRGAIATTSLTKCFGWTSSDAFVQHDIQECMTILFDHLVSTSSATPIANLCNQFNGTLQTTLTCSSCQLPRQRSDVFRDLSLQVRDVDSVPTSLLQYFAPETLEHVACEQCNAKHTHTKTVSIGSLPYILTLQLQRFDMNWATMQRLKLHSSIHIPLTLSLSAHTSDTPAIYELLSILMHTGSAQSGHYFTYARECGTDGWIMFNDAVVTRLTTDEMNSILTSTSNNCKYPISSNCYMLLYRQVKPQNMDHMDAAAVSLPCRIEQRVKESDAEFIRLKHEYLLEKQFVNMQIGMHNSIKPFRVHDSTLLYEFMLHVYDSFATDASLVVTDRSNYRFRVMDGVRGSMMSETVLPHYPYDNVKLQDIDDNLLRRVWRLVNIEDIEANKSQTTSVKCLLYNRMSEKFTSLSMFNVQQDTTLSSLYQQIRSAVGVSAVEIIRSDASTGIVCVLPDSEQLASSAIGESEQVYVDIISDSGIALMQYFDTLHHSLSLCYKIKGNDVVYNIATDDRWSIAELRMKISPEVNIPSDEMLIQVGGRELKGKMLLNACGIDGIIQISQRQVSESESSISLKLYRWHPTASTLNLTDTLLLPPDTTYALLSHRIHQSADVPSGQYVYYARPFKWQLSEPEKHLPYMKWEAQPHSDSKLCGSPYRFAVGTEATLAYKICPPEELVEVERDALSNTSAAPVSENAGFKIYSPEEQIMRQEKGIQERERTRAVIEEKMKVLAKLNIINKRNELG